MDPTIIHAGLLLLVYGSGWLTRHWTLPVAPKVLGVIARIAQHKDLLEGQARLQELAKVGGQLAGALPGALAEVEAARAPAAPAPKPTSSPSVTAA